MQAKGFADRNSGEEEPAECGASFPEGKMSGVHEMQYTVRPYEAGYGKTALPGAILNYLQDAAFEHSVSLGFSVFHLFPLGLTWVLSRYHVKILRYPLSGESVRVRTWYPGSQKPFYLREWKIMGKDGVDIALATSSWLVVDLKTGKPTDGDSILKNLPTTQERALPDNFPSLPLPSREDHARRFPVRISDTDLNRHVNHVQHLLWSLESVPGEFLFRKLPVEMEATYKEEVVFGQEVVVHTEVKENGTCLHHLLLEPGGKEAARVRTVWEDKKKEAASGQ